MQSEEMKNGMRHNGVGCQTRSMMVATSEIPSTTPIRNARMDIPESDLFPSGRMDGSICCEGDGNEYEDEDDEEDAEELLLMSFIRWVVVVAAAMPLG